MIKITADSTCDLSPQILNDLNISLAPLHILVGDEAFDDGVNISPKDIFRYVEEENKTCTTASINEFEYVRFFEKLSSNYESIIHISLGSAFSSCYVNAVAAAKRYDNVYVIDSQNLSTGSGCLAYEAALMAAEGSDVKDICSYLENMVPLLDASFIIDRLDYLHKGGRCSGLELIGAKMLKIRPCIEVVKGNLIIGKKYRGSLESCIKHYVKDRLKRDDIDYSRAFITHCLNSKDLVEKVKELFAQYGNFDEVIETTTGCTISSHCGPNTLGVLVKRKVPKKL